MKIIDISWPINNNITEYKDRKTINISEKIITLHPHTGTHIDAPAHFLKNGKTIDQIDLNRLIGKCRVLDFTEIEEKITEKDLEKHDIKKDEIILLKTKNSDLTITQKFDANFVYLEKSGAEFLVKKEIKSVGIDYLGIERDQPNHETHKTLLENDILIIEGLRLKNVEAKGYFFYCLPIYLENLDSAPARAILL